MDLRKLLHSRDYQVWSKMCLALAICLGATAAGHLGSRKGTSNQDPFGASIGHEKQEIASCSLPASVNAAFLMAPGKWTFPNSPWSIQSTRVTESQLSTLMAVNLSGEAASSADEHMVLLDLVPDLGWNTVREGDASYRWMFADGTRLRVYFRMVKGKQAVIGGVIATKIDDGNWQIVQLRPARKLQTHVVHLLPLPEGCSAVATRVSAAYEVQAELIQIANEIHFDELEKSWKLSGWEQLPHGLWKRGHSMVRVNAIPGHETYGGCIQLTRAEIVKAE